MRPAAILAAIASITSVVSAQAYYGHGMYERDLDPYLQARDAYPEPYAYADADAHADAEVHPFEQIVARALDKRMSDVFNAVVRHFENVHRMKDGKMSQTDKDKCDRECKKTYDNQMGHAKKLKISTASIESDYKACLRYCDTH
ncbi:hypothetical protein MMC30_004391 [Trapelia coarctata]|nr:hypothetical protein [Trapelia coarctata]